MNIRRAFRAMLIGVVVLVLAYVVILGVGAFWFPGAYVSDEKIIAAVENQGFSDVRILDKDITFISWRGCGKDDDAAFQVEATNALGKRVPLTACAGWPFKGVTIRSN
ncbi:MAG: hypothetical protein AAB490_05390 [Patescibacteria group bacterium]